MRIRYRLRARLDIESIGQYIANRNLRAAHEVVARIRCDADRLAVWPHLGHIGRAKGSFERVVAGLPYIIVYEIDEAADEIAIVAVFHGAQDR